MNFPNSYVRSGNQIFMGDPAGQWRLLHNFETEKRAKRWQRDQEKQRPGSVTVGSPPVQITRARIDKMKAEYERRREIRSLVREQARDAARSPSPRPKSSPGDRTEVLARSYVAPARDESSFLRERSKKRTTSRNVRNTRARYGGS